jgi:hypothetical protein
MGSGTRGDNEFLLEKQKKPRYRPKLLKGKDGGGALSHRKERFL